MASRKSGLIEEEKESVEVTVVKLAVEVAVIVNES